MWKSAVGSRELVMVSLDVKVSYTTVYGLVNIRPAFKAVSTAVGNVVDEYRPGAMVATLSTTFNVLFGAGKG